MVRINWKNPLTKGLRFAAPLSDSAFKDFVGNRVPTITGAIERGYINRLQAPAPFFPAERTLDYSLFNMGGWTELTVAVWAQYDGSGTDEHAVFSNWDVNNASFFIKIEPADDTLEITVRDSAGSGVITGVTGFSPYEWHFAVITVNPNETTTHRCYLDGVERSTLNRAITGLGAGNSTGNLQIANDPSAAGSNDFLTGLASSAMIWERMLSAAEVKSLYENTAQIFEAEPVFLPFPVEEEPVEEVASDLELLQSVPIPWTKQPPTGVEIDWTHGIFNYAQEAAVYTFNGYQQSHSKGGNWDLPVVSARDVWEKYHTGHAGALQALSFSSHDGNADLDVNASISNEAAITLFAVFQADTAAGDGHSLIALSEGILSDPGLDMLDIETGQLRHGYRPAQSEGGWDQAVTTVALTNNEWYAAISYRTASEIKLWVKGLSTSYYAALTDSTINSANQAQRTYISIGGFVDAGLGNFLYGKALAFSGFANGVAVSEGLVNSFLDNPWQIFKPKRIPVFREVPTDTRFGVAPRVWTKQPPAGAEIDWGNPLSKNITHLYLPGQSNRNLAGNVDRLDILDTATATYASDPQQGQYFGGDGSSSISAKDVGWDDPVGKTLAVIARPNVGTNLPVFAFAENVGSSTNTIGIWTAGDVRGFVRRDGGLAGVTVDTPSITLGQWIFAVFTVPSQTSQYLYSISSLNYQVDSGVTDLGALDTAIPNVGINCWQRDTTDNQHTCDVAICVGWDRPLSEVEAQAWFANPWQIFKRNIVLPIPESLPDVGTFERQR